MGSVHGTLLLLWCRSGFSAAKVASALTFFPPLPTYDIDDDPDTGEKKMRLFLTDDVATPDDVKVVMLRTSKGNDIPAFLYSYPEAKFTVLYSHANATDCGAMHTRYTEIVRKLGVNLFAYEYSGYGASTGHPSEEDTYADIHAAYDYLCKSSCPEPQRQIILYGQSVGSGPCCFLASRSQVSGLIIHSGIASGLRVLTRSPVFGCFDIYPNVNRISRVKCPVFIIHGRNDQEVDCGHGEELYNCIPRPYQVDPWYVDGRGHNDIVDTPRSEYYKRLDHYIQLLDGQHGSRPL